jgi:hypothetical protein
MSHDGRPAVQFGDCSEIDREGERYLLTLAQPQIRGLDEYPGSTEIDRLAKLSAATWDHDIDDCPSTVPRMQATFHWNSASRSF